MSHRDRKFGFGIEVKRNLDGLSSGDLRQRGRGEGREEEKRGSRNGLRTGGLLLSLSDALGPVGGNPTRSSVASSLVDCRKPSATAVDGVPGAREEAKEGECRMSVRGGESDAMNKHTHARARAHTHIPAGSPAASRMTMHTSF